MGVPIQPRSIVDQFYKTTNSSIRVLSREVRVAKNIHSLDGTKHHPFVTPST